jgi:hypothetical protein
MLRSLQERELPPFAKRTAGAWERIVLLTSTAVTGKSFVSLAPSRPCHYSFNTLLNYMLYILDVVFLFYVVPSLRVRKPFASGDP